MKSGRWSALVRDDRPLKKRLPPALLVSGAISFTFVVFGILDLYVGNSDIFPFLLKDILLPVLLAGLLCFAALAAILLLLRGKLFDVALSLGLGVLLAGYLQGNFLNLNLGQLTGDRIAWEDYAVHSLLNALLWVAIVCAPLVLRYFSQKIWRSATVFVPVLLIGMQLVGLTTSVFTSGVLNQSVSTQYLSTSGIYEVSSQKNIIVLLLDRLDGEYVNDLRNDNPHFFEPLDGFTYYGNNTAQYCRTFPSVTSILTGELSTYQQPADEYFDEAWDNATFLPKLKENNFSTKLFIEKGYTYSDIAQLQGQADNISEGALTYESVPILRRMLSLSAYRYAPHSMKSSFWMSSSVFGQYVQANTDPAPYRTDDIAFYRNLKEKKLTVQDNKNNFAFYHLHGCHDPIYDENVNPIPPEKGTTFEQSKGAFHIVFEYLQQLKDLGLYEDSTIIIMGDHGKSEDSQRLNYSSTTGLFIKPSGSAGTPLADSDAPVSLANFEATVLKEAGISTEGYGTSALDIPSDANVTRRFFYRVNSDKEDVLEEFEIKGDARKFSNWHKVGETVNKYPHG